MYHVNVDARALVQGGLVGLQDVALVPRLVLGAPGVQPTGVELRVHQGPLRLELGRTILYMIFVIFGGTCVFLIFFSKQESLDQYELYMRT